MPKIICQETVLQTCIDTGVRENAFNLTCEVHHVIVDVDYTAGADNCFQKRMLSLIRLVYVLLSIMKT